MYNSASRLKCFYQIIFSQLDISLPLLHILTLNFLQICFSWLPIFFDILLRFIDAKKVFQIVRSPFLALVQKIKIELSKCSVTIKLSNTNNKIAISVFFACVSFYEQSNKCTHKIGFRVLDI